MQFDNGSVAFVQRNNSFRVKDQIELVYQHIKSKQFN